MKKNTIIFGTTNYFSDNETRILIDQLISQYDPSIYILKIFVVDNSHTFSTSQKTVEVFRPDEGNIGLARAWAKQISFARHMDADCCILSNNDIEVPNDLIRKINSILLQNKEQPFSPVIYIKDTVSNDDVVWSCGGRINKWLAKVTHFSELPKHIGNYYETEHLSGCFMVLPKKVYEIVKPDQGYFFRGEEWDLNYSFKQEKFKPRIYPEILINHKENGSHNRFGNKFIYLAFRAKLRFARRVSPLPYFVWLSIWVSYCAVPGYFYFHTHSGIKYLDFCKLVIKALSDNVYFSEIRAEHCASLHG